MFLDWAIVNLDNRRSHGPRLGGPYVRSLHITILAVTCNKWLASKWGRGNNKTGRICSKLHIALHRQDKLSTSGLNNLASMITLVFHLWRKMLSRIKYLEHFISKDIPRIFSYEDGTSVSMLVGRAIAQEVSHRLCTAAARIQGRVRSCGICGGQSGTGAGFLRVLRFPLELALHRLLHNHRHLSSGAGTIRQPVARSAKWTQSHPMRKI
jgi:hypothetical protein